MTSGPMAIFFFSSEILTMSEEYIYLSIYIYIIFPSAFHFSPTKGAFSQDPLSFSPHDISKFRVRHETRCCVIVRIGHAPQCTRIG